MSEFQVTCINKPNRSSPHEHITHIGNASGGWRITREDAIHRINTKQDSFYTLDNKGRKVYIGVVSGDGMKQPYLKTYADNQWNDNLLALPECSG